MFEGRKIRDSNWVRQSFLVGGTTVDGKKVSNMSDIDVRNRTFSSARFKFTDTTPGGNLAINAPPQFTRNADIKYPGLLRTGKGMGRYYSEAIDDNNRLVTMRLGVPAFNSLTTFWTGFYNSDLGALARTGRPKGTMFKIGFAIGYIVPMLSLPLFLVNLGGNLWRYLTMTPSTKYFYLRPTMHLYWNAVNNILNNIAVNKGVIPRVFSDDTRRKLDNTYAFSKDDYEQLKKMLPDIIMDDGGISAYAIATKAQRNSRKVQKAFKDILERTGDKLDLAAEMDKIQQNGLPVNPSKHNGDFLGYIRRWLTSEKVGVDGQNNPNIERQPTPVTEEEAPLWYEYLMGELEDGAQFITFRVDAEGSIQESFSNSVGQPEIAGIINGKSSSARTTTFNLAGGNVGDGMIASAVEGILGGAKDLISGVAEGFGASGLAALAGGAFVDIPNTWQSSSAQLPRMNYTMTLTSAYGNKLSQLINIFLPLSMILAAALPLSTGRNSYTSPFILELYDRGRAQTRLGIIDSLSISRGTGNLPFDNNGNVMSIDVSFSVIDLSTVMHMPIGRGFGLDNLTADAFADDTAFNDYMAILGGLSLQEQVYTWDRVKLSLTRQMTSMKNWASAANFANWAVDGNIGRLLSIFQANANDR